MGELGITQPWDGRAGSTAVALLGVMKGLKVFWGGGTHRGVALL